MANWGTIFADAFSRSYENARDRALKRKEMEADAKKAIQEEALKMLGLGYEQAITPEQARSMPLDKFNQYITGGTGNVAQPMTQIGGNFYRKMPNTPEEEYRLAQAKYQTAMANVINGGGLTPEDLNNVAQGGVPTTLLKSGATQYPESDYMVTTETKNIRGIPKEVTVKKLKPVMPTQEAKEYRGFLKTKMALEQNLGMLAKNLNKFSNMMNPLDPRAMKGGSLLGNIGNTILKLDPNSAEFTTFKSETDKAFQQFRKETTGAQAALAELGWLAPDYPETTDNPPLYKTKALEAIKRLNEGMEMYKQLLSQNYRMSGVENVGKKYNAGRFVVEEE